MYLLIDIGNSRIKWGVYDDENTVVFGACSYEDAIQQVNSWKELSLDSAWVASVGSDKVTEKIQYALSEMGISVHRAVSQTGQHGVTSAYQNPSALGVDRWLGLVAAHQRIDGDALVVSVGTACTLDLIHADGVHQGGWILPGLSLMRKSLNEHTQLLPQVSAQKISGLTLGCSTEEAIAQGTLGALVSSVHSAYLISATESPLTCVLSGGNAEMIYNCLPDVVKQQAIVEPDWVLKGLAVVAGLKLN